MRKIYAILIVLTLAAYAVFFPSVQGSSVPKEAFAVTEHCASGYDLKDETSPFTHSVISPNIIQKICVKAGTETFEYTTNGSDGCYLRTGIGTQSASVVKVGSGPSCKNISYAAFYKGTATPTPTNSPTPTVTNSPTPTPTDAVSPTPTNTGTPTPTEKEECEYNCGGNGSTPTPTATLTPTVTEKPKDEPKNDSSSSSSDNPSSGSVGGTSASSGEVLGTTTFAPTGVFTQTLSNGMLGVGSLFTAASMLLYAKKKK